jgi:hypothetical protein
LLNGDSLDRLYNQFGVRSSPCQSPNVSGLVFPCLIFEAKSELGNIYEAQNQAAHGAAKALAMVRALKDRYRRSPRAAARPPRSLPVVVICAQGHLWEVSVAFDLHDQVAASEDGSAPSAIHIVSIWAGSIASTNGMLYIQSILFRLLLWMLGTWRPAILGMLDIIKATTSSESAAQLGQ